MTLYAIGDIQGCYDELRRLLDQIRFDPALDRLWFVGDLVNRGHRSLETLRFIKTLGPAAVTVLGNHDLHLLSVSHGIRPMKKKDTLAAILNAPDSSELLAWIRHRPLIHYDKPLKTALVHAGLYPRWTVKKARQLAREVEIVLQGPLFHEFLAQMYGNTPNQWQPDLQGMERLRFITNAFTRMRYCDPDARLDFEHKMGPKVVMNGLKPWFLMPNRRSRKKRIVFGHWSTLGFVNTHNVLGLDTGCVWGGRLTAYALDPEAGQPIQHQCKGALKPL